MDTSNTTLKTEAANCLKSLTVDCQLRNLPTDTLLQDPMPLHSSSHLLDLKDSGFTSAAI